MSGIGRKPPAVNPKPPPFVPPRRGIRGEDWPAPPDEPRGVNAPYRPLYEPAPVPQRSLRAPAPTPRPSAYECRPQEMSAGYRVETEKDPLTLGYVLVVHDVHQELPVANFLSAEEVELGAVQRAIDDAIEQLWDRWFAEERWEALGPLLG